MLSPQHDVPTTREQEEALDPQVETRHQPKLRMHLTLQAKGGIGKSHVARILCEYFAGVLAFDMDELNKTLSAIPSFGAALVRSSESHVAMSAGGVRVEALDEMWSEIMVSDVGNVVVDSGSWMYTALLSFMEESDGVELLRAAKREVWFHLIACGGNMQQETLADIDRLIDRWRGQVKILLWDNDYHGEIVAGSRESREKGLLNTRIYREKWKGWWRAPSS